jgi:hypothetical protein
MQNDASKPWDVRGRQFTLAVLVVSALVSCAVPALAIETEQEREHGWGLSVDGKRLFPKNFLCVRVGATDAQDIFVIKPQPHYPLKQALAILHNAGLLGSIEYRLKLGYTADVVGLAKAISREEPAQFQGVALVEGQIGWTPGGGCPVVYINDPPPTNPAASAWAERTAAKYGPDRVSAIQEKIVRIYDPVSKRER